MITIVREPEPSSYEGIYDVPEVARYIKATIHAELARSVSSAKLIRWIRRGVASHDLVDVPGTELLIAFEDLISMRVITALRASGVKWSEIDRTEEWLRDATRHERPFATEYLWTGQGEIFVDWTERLLSASRDGQLALELLKDYLIPVHGLVFSEKTKVAALWEPMAGIVLEPQVQFGSPCLKGTRIPARTVAGMVEAGDAVEWVAQSYGLTRDEVKAACDWEARVLSR
ncbi:MAG: DUF433 domain-containing protein [Chloroflexi bacterium]|nr:DUF433 domain-containing protein [Chloroflexota bacterium]MYF79309.1 DUF433 domain-containing protein [Chloroflexota bacterium]MYK62125.1 DUF433 domain-containing protein [Chloroflexota bacterium]